jgi:hypothetical protein
MGILKISAFEKRDHEYMTAAFGFKELTLCYQMISQLMKLMALIIVVGDNEIQKIYDRMISGDSGVTVKRVITDLKNVPHMYLWTTVCSPKELDCIFPKEPGKDSIMKKFERGSTLWKSYKPGAQELLREVIEAEENLPQGVKAIVRTRLKRYFEIRKKNPDLFAKSSRGTPIHWKYTQWLEYMLKNNEKTLVLEEATLAAQCGYFTTVAECRLLSDCVNVRDDKRSYYFFNDVKMTRIYKELLTKFDNKNLTPVEHTLFILINNRVWTPPVDARPQSY